MGYSYVALQEAVLFTNYPEIYWNTGCLCSEVGTDPEEDFKDLIDKGYIKRSILTTINEEALEEEFYSSLGEEINSMSAAEIEEAKAEFMEEYLSENKTKAKVIKRGKIAKAISEFQQTVNIEYCDINTSGFGFKPNPASNSITCGMKIVAKIGDKLIEEIIHNRPYVSLDDFLGKVKISKDRVVNLIKANCFRNIENRSSMQLLIDYVISVSDTKKKLTMQNAPMLIKYGLLEDNSVKNEVKLFNWMKYIRKQKEGASYYNLDKIAYNYYVNNFDDNSVEVNGKILIDKAKIENIYKKRVETLKNYIKTNEKVLLEKLNKKLFEEQWEKYKMDSESQGEMQSTRVYIGEHELNNYHFVPETTPLDEIEPEKIVGNFFIKGKFFPKYEIYTIVGTVINKDKLKNAITLLTPQGPIDVKVWKNTFALYDQKVVDFKDGKKVLIQDSFFEIGTHLMVTGVLKGTTFVPKKYKGTPVKEVIMKINLLDKGECANYEYEQKLNLNQAEEN